MREAMGMSGAGVGTVAVEGYELPPVRSSAEAIRRGLTRHVVGVVDIRRRT